MFLKLFWAFLKVGTLGFGSGPAMLALIKREMSDLGVMTPEQFTDALALSTALPGPLATKMALYCGYTAGGYTGALAAISAMLLPSTVGILILVRFVSQLRGHARLDAMVRAMGPVVVAIFLYLAISSARTLPPSWDLVVIGLIALVLLFLRVDPVWVILGAVLFGLIFY